MKNDLDKGKYSPDSVRRWALRRLMEAVESELDLSRCNRPDYLEKLTPKQIDKIKRIVYGNHGNIVSVEPVALVDMLKVAADIAGVRTVVSKEDEKRKKGMKLLIQEQGEKKPSSQRKSIDPLNKVLGNE